MKLRVLAVAMVLVAGAVVWAQQRDQQRQQQQQEQQEQQEQQRQEQQQRPSLGPAVEPSLYGPRTSTTTDPRKLLRVRTIFVERIDNSLGDKLMDGLAKMGRFRIVANRNEADAVVRGTCFDSHRLKSVHSEVFLADRSGSAIWQDIVRRPYNPPSLPKVVDDTAAVILQHLGDSIKEAGRKQ